MMSYSYLDQEVLYHSLICASQLVSLIFMNTKDEIKKAMITKLVQNGYEEPFAGVG